MRLLFRSLAAMSLLLACQTFVTTVAIAATSRPTVAQYERDLQELASWIQDITERQKRISKIVEEVWLDFQDHNNKAIKASEAESQKLLAVLLSQIGDTRKRILAERAGIEGIQPLKGNLIVLSMPSGHLDKLRQHCLDTADRFLRLVDRAETQVIAMSLGEVGVGREFSLLIFDGSIEIVRSQLTLSQSNRVIVRKGSANAAKLESIVQIYEGMEHVLREQRAIAAGEGLGIDLVKIKTTAAKMQATVKSGRDALVREYATFNANRKFMTPNMIDAYLAQLEHFQQLFDYLTAQYKELVALPDTLNVDAPNDPMVMNVLDRFADMESKVLELHAAMLERLAS